MRQKAFFALLVFTSFFAGFVFAEWNEYRPQGGRCLVSVPKTPDHSVKDVSSDVGTLKMHQFMMDYGEHAFLFTYTDYPAKLFETKSNNDILEDVVKGSTGDGEVIREVELEIDGFAGKEYVVQKTDFTLKARIFLVKQRLYQLIAVYPPDKASTLTPQADQFLQSFRLLH